jgi:hypothetical protein
MHRGSMSSVYNGTRSELIQVSQQLTDTVLRYVSDIRHTLLQVQGCGQLVLKLSVAKHLSYEYITHSKPV